MTEQSRPTLYAQEPERQEALRQAIRNKEANVGRINSRNDLAFEAQKRNEYSPEQAAVQGLEPHPVSNTVQLGTGVSDPRSFTNPQQNPNADQTEAAQEVAARNQASNTLNLSNQPDSTPQASPGTPKPSPF